MHMIHLLRLRFRIEQQSLLPYVGKKKYATIVNTWNINFHIQINYVRIGNWLFWIINEIAQW